MNSDTITSYSFCIKLYQLTNLLCSQTVNESTFCIILGRYYIYNGICQFRYYQQLVNMLQTFQKCVSQGSNSTTTSAQGRAFDSKNYLVQENFLFQGLDTQVFLYEDAIIFSNIEILSSLKFSSQISYHIIQEDQLVKGFIIKARQDYVFQKQIWSHDSQLIRMLSKSLKRQGFHEFFNIKRKIGQGAFGKVHLATEIKTGTQVAVKSFLKPSIQQKALTQSVSNMVNQQVKILRLINHKNIVKFYGLYETAFAFYIVMQLIQGKTLKKLLQEKRLSETQKKSFLFELINSTLYLKSLNIVHRDLKPDNIMIQQNTQRLVLIDFGLSIEVPEQKSVDNIIQCGTIGYMAPQILQMNKTQTTIQLFKAQVYSLGTVFFKILFNTDLHQGASQQQILKSNIKSKSIANGLLQSLKQDQKDILISLLEKDATLRISLEMVQNHWYFTEDKNKYKKIHGQTSQKNKKFLSRFRKFFN